MDTIIQFPSTHPHDHKLAALSYYINRMIDLPTTQQAEKQECNMTHTIAQNSGFQKYIVHRLKKKLTVKKKKQEFPVTEIYIEQQNNMKWVTFA